MSIFRATLKNYTVYVAVDAPDTINGTLNYSYEITATTHTRARKQACREVAEHHLNERRMIIMATVCEHH